LFFFPPRGACTRLLYPSEISARRAQRNLLPIPRRWIQINAVTRVVCLLAELASPSPGPSLLRRDSLSILCCLSPHRCRAAPPRGAAHSGSSPSPPTPRALALQKCRSTASPTSSTSTRGASPRSRRRHLRSGPSSFTPR